MYEDKYLVCQDCGCEFLFSASEQEFYAEKGFENLPGRCAPCRKARKQMRQNQANTRSNREDRPVYNTVCAACGHETTVPFEPNNDRPVYCRDCFQARKVKTYR